MSNSRVQADYARLEEVSRRFDQMSETVDCQAKAVRAGVEDLRISWQGEGAGAFLREMDQTVLPGIDRLTAALAFSVNATGRIAQTFRTAEEEASQLFRLGAADSVPGPNSPAEMGDWRDTLKAILGPIKDSALGLMTLSLIRSGSSYAGQMLVNGPKWLKDFLLDMGPNLTHISADKLAARIAESGDEFIGKGGLTLGAVCTFLGLGLDAWQDFDKYWNAEPTHAKFFTAVGVDAAVTAVDVAGGVGGAYLGAAIGSIFPGPGTVIGAVVGGVVGGWVSDQIWTAPIGQLPLINNLISPELGQQSIKDYAVDGAFEGVQAVGNWLGENVFAPVVDGANNFFTNLSNQVVSPPFSL